MGQRGGHGENDLASAYACEPCSTTFSREQGAGLAASAADRLGFSDEGRHDRMGHLQNRLDAVEVLRCLQRVAFERPATFWRKWPCRPSRCP